MNVVGVTFGVNSIVWRVDSTGGVHFRSKCDCLKPGGRKECRSSQTQANRCDRPEGGVKGTNHRLADASVCSCDPRACLICNWGGACV